MSQIQQLTALAFARDDSESAAQPGTAQAPTPAGAAPTPAHQLSVLADTAAATARRSVALADRIQQIEHNALLGLASGREGQAGVPTEPRGSSAAAPDAGGEGEGGEGSQWASAFIADARQAADAAQSLEQPSIAGREAAVAETSGDVPGEQKGALLLVTFLRCHASGQDFCC